MEFQPVYLVAVKNLRPFLEAVRRAQAPEKVNLRFIEELGFKSTNDRLFIPLLKAMKFVDEAGKPTSRYHSFFDDSEWKRVLADGVRDAYPDLFRINKEAHNFSREQLAGKLKSLSEGKLSPAVLANITRTFLELVKLADFSTTPPEQSLPPVEPEQARKTVVAEVSQPSVESARGEQVPTTSQNAPSLVYRIEIVLPAVRDQAVYDAIFRSAREHLLK